MTHHDHPDDPRPFPAPPETQHRSVGRHQVAVAELTTTLDPVRLPLAEAGGCILAEDVYSRTPIPLFDNSAMDGYAVRGQDVTGAGEQSPITLPVVADLPAGDTRRRRIEPGQAARIMTGAPMPEGADAVVPVEHTDAGTHQVRITTEPAPAAHIRRSGEDTSTDDLILDAGTLLGGRQIAAAAACGHGELTVHRRPRVAVLSTGSELVAAGQECAWGQIPDSNSHLLAESVRECGAEALRFDAVADDAATFREVLDSLAGEVDMIVCSGGVSVGAYDVVKDALAPLETMWFGPIAMQPGKPQGLGSLPEEGPVVVALPGNPVSVHVGFEVLVRPALDRLAGRSQDSAPAMEEAMAAVGWPSPAGREQYMPVVLDGTGPGGQALVRPTTARGSGSHLVASLAAAQGLARVPADQDEVGAGDAVALVRTIRRGAR